MKLWRKPDWSLIGLLALAGTGLVWMLFMWIYSFWSYLQP